MVARQVEHVPLVLRSGACDERRREDLSIIQRLRQQNGMNRRAADIQARNDAQNVDRR